MSWQLRLIYILWIFVGSTFLTINLTWLRYGIPEHYDGAWWKVVASGGMVLLGTLALMLDGREGEEN